MADIVNLNKARKAKLKQQKAAKAAQNRIVHGLPKHEKARERLEQVRERNTLEGHVRKNTPDTKTIDE